MLLSQILSVLMRQLMIESHARYDARLLHQNSMLTLTALTVMEFVKSLEARYLQEVF